MDQCAWSNIRLETTYYLFCAAEYGDARDKEQLRLLALRAIEAEELALRAARDEARQKVDDHLAGQFAGGVGIGRGRGVGRGIGVDGGAVDGAGVGRGIGVDGGGGDGPGGNVLGDHHLGLEDAEYEVLQKEFNDLEDRLELKRVQLGTCRAEWTAKNTKATDLKTKRDHARRILVEHIKRFFSSRWIVLMEASDLTALRVIKEDLIEDTCRVRFCLSSSARGWTLQSILKVADEMGIDAEGMRCEALYELTGGAFRKLPQHEMNTLGFRRQPEL